MSEEQKPAETPAEEVKDAEGQSTHEFYCRDCGKEFWSDRLYPSCPKCYSSNTVRK